MNDKIQLIGALAGFLTTIAFVPQVIKVWRSKSAADISISMYLIFISGLVLWLLYGIFLAAWPIIISNIVTLVLAGSVLVMKLRFEKPPHPAITSAG